MAGSITWASGTPKSLISSNYVRLTQGSSHSEEIQEFLYGCGGHWHHSHLPDHPVLLRELNWRLETRPIPTVRQSHRERHIAEGSTWDLCGEVLQHQSVLLSWPVSDLRMDRLHRLCERGQNKAESAWWLCGRQHSVHELRPTHSMQQLREVLEESGSHQRCNLSILTLLINVIVTMFVLSAHSHCNIDHILKRAKAHDWSNL